MSDASTGIDGAWADRACEADFDSSRTAAALHNARDDDCRWVSQQDHRGSTGTARCGKFDRHRAVRIGVKPRTLRPLNVDQLDHRDVVAGRV
jgi:hypothetical protein